MKKIPTYFERDWSGDRSRVVNKIHDGCAWVSEGEGVATRKIDGTCCMVRGGKLYKRQEIKAGAATSVDFEQADFDKETGKRVGWRPVGDGPEDRWHREAFSGQCDGTYELVGPKVQGNPDRHTAHLLIPHTIEALAFAQQPPRDFDGLRDWLSGQDIEGVVFHHPDGRMAKIKLRDFRLKRVLAT